MVRAAAIALLLGSAPQNYPGRELTLRDFAAEDVSNWSADQYDDAWIFVADMPNGSHIDVNAGDYIRQRQHPKAYPQLWLRVDASKARSIPWRTATNLYELDCASKTTRLLHESARNADGSEAFTREYRYSASEHAAPETIGATLIKAFCAK